jgi:hypothetical protein
MRKLAVAFCVVAVAAVTSASAAEYRAPLFPAPAVFGFQDAPPAPEGVEAAKPVAESKAITLYECVKYEDLDHVACCAETKIIKVIDPCWKPDPCACCQKPKCVYVKICVPKKVVCCKPAPPSCCAPKPTCCAPAPKPCCNKCHSCGCEHKKEKVTCSKSGKYQKYDYGKYRVEIRVKSNGWIVVDYDN